MKIVSGAVFICDRHCRDPDQIAEGSAKDGIVWIERMPCCCCQEGLDHIRLYMKAEEAKAMIVVDRDGHALTQRLRAMAIEEGLDPLRILVHDTDISSSSIGVELSRLGTTIASAMDQRDIVRNPSKRSGHLIMVAGNGATRDGIVAYLRSKGAEVDVWPRTDAPRSVSGDFGDLRISSTINDHGPYAAVILAFDMEIETQVERDGGQGMLIIYDGSMASRSALHDILGTMAQEDEVYVLCKEMPFLGKEESIYVEAQGRGVRFLRGGYDRIDEGIVVHDEHLGGDVLLHPASIHTITERGPPQLDMWMRALGLPKARDARASKEPWRSYLPGVFLCGSALTDNTAIGQEEWLQVVADNVLTWIGDKEPSVAPVVRVDEERCSRCLLCLRVCPYQAPIWDEDKGVIIEPGRCQGCGICLSACPSMAIGMPPYDLRASRPILKGETR